MLEHKAGLGCAWLSQTTSRNLTLSLTQRGVTEMFFKVHMLWKVDTAYIGGAG